MKVYARVSDGKVAEIILPMVLDDGSEAPIELRFTPEFVSTLVDITDLDPQPEQSWTYNDGVFAAPITRVPTQQEIEEANMAEKNSLKAAASQAMTPIFMALQLGDATDDETVKAKAWRAYYQDLDAVDVSIAVPVWPVPPAYV